MNKNFILKLKYVMKEMFLINPQRKNISKDQHNAIPNGVICLKGGDLQAETHPFRRIIESAELSTYFEEEWFKEKHVIYVPV